VVCKHNAPFWLERGPGVQGSRVEVVDMPLTSSAVQAHLSYYSRLKSNLFQGRHMTLHGLCSGCAITLALSGAQLPDIMAHVGWKSSKTADHYIKLNQVLAPGGPSDNLSKISLDLSELYAKQNHLQGISKAF